MYLHPLVLHMHSIKELGVMNVNMKRKQHIVLVHGACHGAWCWFKVATMLESAGYMVTVLDLAASGIDGRRIEEVVTLVDYSQPLLEMMASLGAEEKVILVGHSLGGMNIALAADRFPEKVAAVIFVTAFMPDCTSAPSFVIDKYTQLNPIGSSGWMDTQFRLIGGTPEKPHTSMFFGPEFMASKLYQLCLPEDLKLATTLVRPGSLFLEDLRSMPLFSQERYGLVPCFYIECHEDIAIPKNFQQWMIQNHQLEMVMVIERADHMAMLSAPQELCQCLFKVADYVGSSTVSG